MSTRMLIDARHPEETRVAVVRNNRVEEYDYESVTKRQIKGNIYLAKVTRVEPSLQAAFVEFGGNRQGFLPFSEIHPDYYQIPVEDREALLKEEAAEARAHAESEDAEEDALAADGRDEDEQEVVSVGGDDEEDHAPRRLLRPGALRRRYRIQEVIKRRQILLVQVAKEERGSKGAALTTYLSLPGRYCVLMPNSPRGGGVSRKITNPKDRRQLKRILNSLDVPEGMGVIIRTAGLGRTKGEIKRDLDYLLRLWDEIRERTLNSLAPALIYEEGDLIKRTIRDLYSRDIEEVLVEGEAGYRAAKEFMSLLMPSHARRVKHYRDSVPLFQRFQVEQQLEAIHNPVVQLKSGGYLVFNPTEALVAIDVNSGRATREHHIEETALQTNLEAAEEIARQLRLRDLAGLIVIDFIDMENRQNIRAVERKLREALRHDRARIQVGRISSFGLLEMSRQRLRPNLVEASTITCPRCGGAGVVRSIQSGALTVLRAIEQEGVLRRSEAVTVHTPADVAHYLLNEKRAALAALEQQHDLKITISPSEALGAEPFALERTPRRTPAAEGEPPVTQDAEAGEPAEKAARAPDESRDKETGEKAAAGAKRRERDARRTGRKRGGRRRTAKKEAASVAEQPAAEEGDQPAQPRADSGQQEPPAAEERAETAAAGPQEQTSDGRDATPRRRRPPRTRSRGRRSEAAGKAAGGAGEPAPAADTPSTGEETAGNDESATQQPVTPAEAVEEAASSPFRAAAETALGAAPATVNEEAQAASSGSTATAEPLVRKDASQGAQGKADTGAGGEKVRQHAQGTKARAAPRRSGRGRKAVPTPPADDSGGETDASADAAQKEGGASQDAAPAASGEAVQASTAAVQAQPEPASAPGGRAETAASEAVAQDAPKAAEAGEPESGPKKKAGRRGWWQRALGGS